MNPMSVIERMMTNPDWEFNQFFFVRIEREDDEFSATLYLDTSEKSDLHTFARITAPSISLALESLNNMVSEQIVTEAAGHFLEKSLKEEEEELKA